MPHSRQQPNLPTEPPLESALAQRRGIFARLVRARNAAEGTERATAEAALQRCRVRLSESVDAASARHAATRAQHAVLARLYPESAPAVMRAVIARSTLRSWCRRLKRDIRSQRKAVKLLAESSAALARIAQQVAALQASFTSRDADWRACVQTFCETPARRDGRDAFFRAKPGGTADGAGEDRRYMRLCEMQDVEISRQIQEDWSRVSHGLYDAVNASQYLAKTARASGGEVLLARVHRRAQGAPTLHDMSRAPDAAKARALAGIAAEAQNDYTRVEEWRRKLVLFLRTCDEEMLALTASAIELTDNIHNTRLALAEREFGSRDVATLRICEHRLHDITHTCAEGRCKGGALLGTGRAAPPLPAAERNVCFRTLSSTSSEGSMMGRTSLVVA